MSMWRYAILEKDGYFEVCEEYLNDDGTRFAYSERELGSETKEGLIDVLEMALKDVKEAVKEDRTVPEAEDSYGNAMKSIDLDKEEDWKVW